MALYFIETERGTVIVRAKNGKRAQELVAPGAVTRLHEDGPEGLVDVPGDDEPPATSEPMRYLGDK